MTIRRSRPIADKLLHKLLRYQRNKVIDLSAFRACRQHADFIQQSVVSNSALAELHPAHALYVYAQNQLSVMAELLTSLPELDRLSDPLAAAEDSYMPSGPPMSPLTLSYYSCWSLFDFSVGNARETLCTTAMAVGRKFGMHEDLLHLFELMQASHMAVYRHEGFDKDVIELRELVTDRVCRTICPSGYRGRAGELWYARVLPPPASTMDVHVVFTTPYRLIAPSEDDWLAYFDRSLSAAPSQKRDTAYEQHMKYGPARDYWPEFVFEAYVNHEPGVIFLSGLPDVAESRPCSRVNMQDR
jgi:hypothetical protein